MADWDPDQYELFKRERSQPFWDLVSLVQPRADMRVVDLGCGTGELTARLKQRLAAADVLGVDSSATMLAQANGLVQRGLAFRQQRIEDFRADGALDLLLSNAALHWVEDHEALIPRLFESIAPGGQLAIQVPANHDQPSHSVAAELATEAPFVSVLGGYTGHRNVLAPERYARLLHELGASAQHVRLQVYGHTLPSPLSVVEWVEGTTLRPFAERMGERLFAAFLATYRTRLLAVLGPANPCFFPFKRILMWATR